MTVSFDDVPMVFDEDFFFATLEGGAAFFFAIEMFDSEKLVHAA